MCCSRGLAATLLAAHLLLLAAFAQWRWTGAGGLPGVVQGFWARRQQPGSTGNGSATHTGSSGNDSKVSDSSRCSIASAGAATGRNDNGRIQTAEAVWMVWTGNFIGIVCARTLHYQFYSWYCHSLPFLIWSTALQTWQKLALWSCIEVVWNIYPPTALSSTGLLVCHCTLLTALWWRPAKL